MAIKVLGIDLGKSSFHVVAHDAKGKVLYRSKFSRTKLISHLHQAQPTTVAFETCAGAHWLGRLCQEIGHTPQLLPPQYVKPYVKRHKNDFIDAEAIAEASSRPSMRFVPVKTETAQVVTTMHRLRDGWIKERTACMTRIGAILLEFGLSLPKGHTTMKRLFFWIEEQPVALPEALLDELREAHTHYGYLNQRILDQETKIKRFVRRSEACQRLKTIPGIGDMSASLLVANVGNGGQFRNGRDMAAWLGLVPQQYSTGGKSRLLGISKRGNKRLRTFLVHGARSVLSRAEEGHGPFRQWLLKLRAAKPFNVAAVALANKIARIAWAVLSSEAKFEMKVA